MLLIQCEEQNIIIKKMQKNQQNQSTNTLQDLFIQIQSQFIHSVVTQEPHSNIIQPLETCHDPAFKQQQIEQTFSTQHINGSSSLRQDKSQLKNDAIKQDNKVCRDSHMIPEKIQKQVINCDKKGKKSYMPPCLKKICQQLLLSQIQFISSLACISAQLKACAKYLKQQNILPEQICEQLFSCQEQGTNWHNMQQISKNFSKKFSNFLISGQHSQLLQKLQGIQSLQIVYKQEYTRIGKMLQIISYIQEQIKKYLLQVQYKKQVEKNQNKQSNTYYKQILNHRTSQRKIVQSEIVDNQQFETIKFKSTYRVPKKREEHPFFYKKTMEQQNQYIKTPTNYIKCKNLIEICIKIKKNIFKPLNKLKQFIHLITRYTHIQMHTYQSVIKQYKQNNKTIIQNATQYNNWLQQMSKIKKTVIKISAILQNIFGNQYQQMDQYQNTIKQLFYRYPQLFCTEYQSQNQQTTPLIIPINTLQIYYMGIPCQLYLINNYLIIIKCNKQNVSLTTSKIRSKKNKEIIKLAIVEIDHTTQVQIVSNNMLYEQHVVYVSGGLKSSGVFLQFRPANMDQQEIKTHKSKCKQYIKQNNIDISQFKCPICSILGDPTSKPSPDSTLRQLHKSTITSNIQILKTILQLNIWYNSFIYYSRLHNINVYTCHKISYWKLDIKKQQIKSEINVIYSTEQEKEKVLQRQFVTGFHYNQEKQTIPNTHLLAMRVLAIEYCYLDEKSTQKKYYIIELQVYLYDHFILCSPNSQCKNQCKNYHSNHQCVTQIINMSQQKFYQLEDFIFRHYPNVLTVNRPSRSQQYLDIMRFQQSRQLFLSSYLPNQNILQKQSMMITELFNTLFKTTSFRNKPEVLLYRLGISEGMWKILVQGVPMDDANGYQNLNGNKFKKIDLWCQCEQCENVPQVEKYEDEYSRLGLKKSRISKFWRYYNHVSLYPYSSNYEVVYKHQKQRIQVWQKQQSKKVSQFLEPLNRKQKTFRQTGCPIFMHRVQKNYINQLLLQKTIQKAETEKQIIQNMNTKQKFGFEILDYFNNVKYINYLARNYNFSLNQQSIHKKQCGLLNTIIQSSKVRSLNILLYCLPSLNDYYHQLQNTQKQQKLDTNIFQQIAQQYVEIGIVQNHGFTQKLLINIHKDTTCRHLKYIIAQRLQICQDYISHFMQNFILVLVKKSQVGKERWYSSWFKSNKSKNCTEYCVNQMNVLQDHEKVYDILDFIKKYQDKYFISLKKNIKTQPILITLLKSSQNQLKLDPKRPEQKLIQNYYKLLELELAQVCYKINHQQLLIEQPNTTLIKYIAMLLSYLHIKLKDRRQRYKQKYAYELDQRLLIKTGVISKSVFDLYYNNELEQPVEQNLKTKLLRRKHLQIMCKAQIEVEENQTQILNKLMRLVYNKTNWNFTIQPILYIKNVQNKQQLINCYIFINQEGIVINNIRAQMNTFVNVNTSMLKSKFKKSKIDDIALLDFDYFQLDVEIYGTVLTIVTKKVLHDSQNKQLLQKYSLFSSHPYYLMQLIKYYKILAETTKTLDNNQMQCNTKQRQKEKQRRNSNNIENYCRNFAKRIKNPSRKEQEQKAYNKLSAQFRRTDSQNLKNGLSDRTQSQ